jgi:hypothetical protein
MFIIIVYFLCRYLMFVCHLLKAITVLLFLASSLISISCGGGGSSENNEGMNNAPVISTVDYNS